jgi:hypothetical protein
MKDKFITFGIGLGILIALSVMIVLIMNTNLGFWIIFGIFVLVASYVLGVLVREVWRLRKI